MFDLLPLQMVLSHLKFSQTRLCTKEKTWNIRICQVLNLPADNKDKNKSGAKISQYTVIH